MDLTCLQQYNFTSLYPNHKYLFLCSQQPNEKKNRDLFKARSPVIFLLTIKGIFNIDIKLKVVESIN